MVGIVKWLRHRIVIPACVGSNPTIHPIIFHIDVGVSPSGKATDSDSVIRRFESFYPSQSIGRVRNHFAEFTWWHSQVVRHRSAKPLSPGSNPGATSKKPLSSLRGFLLL